MQICYNHSISALQNAPICRLIRKSGDAYIHYIPFGIWRTSDGQNKLFDRNKPPIELTAFQDYAPHGLVSSIMVMRIVIIRCR
ncbi:MAG: hypothetical protein DRP46_13460 [Candidatus Zixiibacteriota bacterium]|nr:MAG: hypothetical protein DRP46_13460 [candidate division Zixibacteria bacterium]